MILKKLPKLSMVSSIYKRVLLFAVLCTLCLSSDTFGQWRIPTPRDTVSLKANSSAIALSKIALTVGTDMYLQISGTFSFWTSQPSDGIDGGYTYKVPGWNIFNPLSNPPVYNSTTFDWGLWITNSTQQGYFIPKFAPAVPYQSNHQYAARVPSLGNKFSFQIHAPSAAYYNNGSGGVTINLARWTAGIAVKLTNIDFGNVMVAQPVSVLDSIASYGIDPLQIDSIILVGTNPSGNSDFSFISSRNDRFALQTETAAEIKVTATPSNQGDIYGQLLLYCHNADPNNRLITIGLHVKGIKPTLDLSPTLLNFGKVRIGIGSSKNAFVGDYQGLADLTVTGKQFTLVPPTTDPNAFTLTSPVSFPFKITPGSNKPLAIFFNPKLRTIYHAWLHIQGNNVPTDSVELIGEGAEPVPIFSDSILDFGQVYTSDVMTKPLTLTNKGNWTCSVIQASIVGPQRAVFSFKPGDSDFFVEPDSVRTFQISFQPGTRTNLNYRAYFVVVYDDFSIDSVLLIGTEVPPVLTFSDTEYNFGKVRIGASKDTVITLITNTGNVPVTLSEQDIRPSTHFRLLTTLSAIPPHTTDTVYAEFKPLVPGPLQAYYYTLQPNGKRDSVHLLGIGAVAKAIFAPPEINFGIVKSNTPVTDSTVLSDSGDYPLSIAWYEIAGQDANDFKVVVPPTPKASPQSPYMLREDSSMTITVRFFTNARTGVAHYAWLYLHYTDSSKDSIRLEAIEEAQYLQFGQSSIDFGKVRVRTRDTASALFRNGSGKTLQVDSLWLTSDSSVFTLLDKISPVLAGDSSKVHIQFLPTARAQYSGYLHGDKGDFKNDSIQIRGIGALPLPIFAPDTIDFKTVPLFQISKSGFDLIDNGDWPARVINTQLIGDNTEFKYWKTDHSDSTKDLVQPQLSSTYGVSFTPNKTIVYHSAKILFTFDDSTQGIVYLKGYDESPYLVLDADSINFGKVRIGRSQNAIANLVSTYTKPLTASYVTLTNTLGNAITAVPTGGSIQVPPQTLLPINVSFKPTTVGPYAAQLAMANADTLPHYDTTFITGIGAKPIPSFSLNSVRTDTLDFGSLFNGYSATKSIVLSDSGNWDISTLSYKIVGVNSGDFKTSFAQQIVVGSGSSKSLPITFQASTPYQPAARYAEIDFILDDSSIFKLYLKAQDIAPVVFYLQFDNEYLRPTDVVHPNLRLLSAIPDTLKLNDIKGTIQWDPTVVTLVKVENPNLVLTPLGNDPPGQYSYELTGASNNQTITVPGTLLRLSFKPAPGSQPGMQTTLKHLQFSLPARSEFAIQETGGVLIIDSACGDTHLISGSYGGANYIEMNSPNPFGGNGVSEATTIHYSVGADNTDVFIRILDVTGREVLRPVDHMIHKKGYYALTVRGASIPNSGVYFYEYTAGSDDPVVRKMVVQK